jgi:hypothetical protein
MGAFGRGLSWVTLSLVVGAGGCDDEDDDGGGAPPVLPCGEGEPSIAFVFVPGYGSTQNLTGQVCHVWPDAHRVAVYIYVGGGWWTKPYWNWPATTIMPDGSWVCDITTGGIDPQATQIVAYLIPGDYDPPLASGGALPDDVLTNALAQAEVDRPAP